MLDKYLIRCYNKYRKQEMRYIQMTYTYEEMLHELEMCGFGTATLRCFTLAYEGGATEEELTELYFDLLGE